LFFFKTFRGEMILRIFSLGLFGAAFTVALLTDGGVYPGTLSLAAILMALSLASSVARDPLHAETAGIFFWALSVWLFVAAWTLVQSLPLPGGIFANSAWSHLTVLGIETQSASISVAPGNSVYSLVPLSLAFMTFLAALQLFRSDRQAEMALRIFACCGAAFALFAIFEFKLFPRMLMFAPKHHYLGSLTAPFVNRNTAATFYGLVLIALTVCFALEGSKTSGAHSRAHRFDRRWLFGAMIVVTLLALALTTSRGGIIAAAVSMAGLVTAMIYRSQNSSAGAKPWMRRTTSKSRAVGLAGGGLLIFTALAFLIFDRTLMRVERQGSDDGRFCVYSDIVRATEGNWSLGIGAGGFEDYFAAYMNPACGMANAWARAHNSYLDMALAYGIFVTVLMLVVALTVIVKSVMKGLARRRSKTPVVWGCLAAVILVFLHAVVDFSIQISGFAMSFMFFLAITMTISVNPTGGRRIVT
jgi:hypothetical protein